MHEPLTNIRPVIFLHSAKVTPCTEVWRDYKELPCDGLRKDVVDRVSEDIDPVNTDAVLWSLAYRSNPQDDVHIEPYRSIGYAAQIGGRRPWIHHAD